jgi:ATP-dependent DNA helicase DinG
MGVHCPEIERCFFMALRKEAAASGILVVNHHLLFADLAARHGGAGYESAVVLPPFDRVIIDEAHTIEDSATSFFSKGWGRPGINRSLSRLYRKRRKKETGLLLRFTGGFTAVPGAVVKAITALRSAADAADAAALALCGDEGQFRLVRKNNGGPLGILRQPLEELQKAAGLLTSKVNAMIGQADQDDPAVWEIKAVLRRMESIAEICGLFLEYDLGTRKAAEEQDVFFLFWNAGSRDDRENRVTPWAAFTVSPVSVAASLKEALFDANKTVVCVSATLSTGAAVPDNDSTSSLDAAAASFRYWAGRTGAALGDRKLLCGVFPSPFPYNKRTLLAAPTDAPLPDSPEYPAFAAHAITELVRLCGGSALILFTSYQALRNAFEEAAPVLEKDGIRCLKQGDDDRSRLLQVFLEDKSSVLFGTDSFWEGVDAPGETLRLLILCRLPFKTLKDPVFEARREYLESCGRSSFAELSLPDAVMKFKQGFGRLMRNSSDYGAVVVLDGRVLHKYYGKAFLQALPDTKTSFKEFDDVLRDLESFLY